MSRLHPAISGALARVAYAIGGALALGMALVAVLIHVDRLRNPGNPDAGQLGVWGVVIGLPLGFVIGWFVAQHKEARRLFLALCAGTLVGGLVGGYAVAALLSVDRQLQSAPPDGELTGGPASAVVGLLFSFIGMAAGGLLARRWRST